MAPNRPHLHAVASEPSGESAPGRPPLRRRAAPWLVAALVGIAALGWWLYALESAALRRTQGELARAEARVFSLEGRMLQLRRSASALAATLAAAEEQARALEALAAPAEVAPGSAAPARGEGRSADSRD
jgi:hypothetical protein